MAEELPVPLDRPPPGVGSSGGPSPAADRRRGWRTALQRAVLAGAVAVLVLAVLAGLRRIGWDLDVPRAALREHGFLAVSGFLGSVVALERAIALGHRAGYLAPLAGVGSALLVIADVAHPLAAALAIVAPAGLLVIFLVLLRRRGRTLELLVLTAGAAAWLGGNVLWTADWAIPRLLPWWIGFLALTIAGERLELTRWRPISGPARAAMLGALAGLGLGLAFSLAWRDGGAVLFGAALVVVAAWLLRYDIARRSIRRPGLPRYMAVALIASYVWLAVVGGLFWHAGDADFGPDYDALIHAFFLGVAVSAIMAHAPVILPAVARVPQRFHPLQYAGVIALHGTLGLRVGADLAGWPDGREWGALGNALALAVFAAGLVLVTAGPGLRGALARRAAS